MVFCLQTGPPCFPLDWEPPEVRVCEFPSGWEFLRPGTLSPPSNGSCPKEWCAPFTQMPFLDRMGWLLKLGLQVVVSILVPSGPRLNCLQTCLQGWEHLQPSWVLWTPGYQQHLPLLLFTRHVRCVGGEARSPLPIWVVYLALLVPYSGLASSVHGLGSILGRAWEWTGHSVPLSAH